MKKMKAYRLLDWEQNPEIVEIEVPVPKKGEILLKVAGNGLCHSDIGMKYMTKEIGEQIGWSMPFTLGHEIGGYVEQIGEGITNFKVGEPVVAMSAEFCGECEYCVKGLTNNCEFGHAGRGYGRDGGLAEYVLITNPKHLIKLKSLDPIVAGPLTDAGATSYHGVKRILPKLIPGSYVAIIGAGGLGSYAIQFLNVMSTATIIAIDMNENRLQLSKDLGASFTIQGVNEDTYAKVMELTHGRGVEAVLDFAGFDTTIDLSLKIVRKFGSYGLVGAGGGKGTIPWFEGLPKDAEIFTYQGSSYSDVKEVISLAEKGLIKVDVDLFSFDEIHLAYEKMEKGELKGRAVITP